MEKGILGLAGEYAVASEICRRNYYAQITLGRLKRTDILVYNTETDKELRIEVKAKQKRDWPGIRGVISKQVLLIFVDFQNKKENERPDFYILDADDWQNHLQNYVVNRPGIEKLIDGFIPLWKKRKSETKKKKYIGVSVRPKQIIQHKERWGKLDELLK